MASKLSLGIVGIGLSTFGMAIMLGATGGSPATAQTASAQSQASASEPTTIAQYYDGSEIDPANAQPLPTVPRAMNRAYYSRRGNYFDNRQIWKSFSLILGIPAYPEQDISRDGRAVNQLYRELLDQQVASDPVLRSPDLPNPYTGSVLTTPLVIVEDAIEAAPMFPPPIRRPTAEPAAEPAPVAPQRNSSDPIPALW
ncbi:MAG: hypothetical protein KME07_10220 [Pegethrix bostrychoides GSE-TBD4-15B]|jgi:hypothetical protein|uniref:Uncharacterized protein n=1 Tax=Pegethrix bostrychoides GSE-TBD4-15B TaxID=2839662 RepID=A0A951U5S2_9CYAN|nr:hypothetical protein [Pegethrix bostrychoides GSE-TBD4-15B]